MTKAKSIANPDRRAPLTNARPSRRAFLTNAVIAPVLIAGLRTVGAAPIADASIKSPDGQIKFLLLRDRAQLSYQVTFRNRAVIETAPLGIVIDGVDLGRGVAVGKVRHFRRNERYVTRGLHSEGIDNCNAVSFSLTHPPSRTPFIFEARVFNDGVAFRYIVPGHGKRVPDEATGFTIPDGGTLWFHDFEGHYEGIHQKKEIAAVKAGEWAAPPLTIKLAGGSGYAAITEAALVNYAGMGLEADGQRGFRARLGHALPVSHPFDLRYGKEEAQRLAKPAAIEGPIVTPWRVVIVGQDLNTLVNSDIVNNVSAPPDKTLFPAGLKTDWVKPGRAVWRYLDGGENTFEGMKEFSRLAGQLGFEYNVVEGFWQRWTEDQVRALVDYSKQNNVGLWFWKHSKDLRTPEARDKFFSLCNRGGIAGAKIDFFDHEAKEVIDLYQALLRNAAEHRVMVEFHGANKPAGETRTWPNELTREAVRGLEYRSTQTRARHNTTLPFTRFLAGHGDYTPMHFGERRRETSWAHQIASAAVFTSPLLIFGAHPQNILENPAVDLIKMIPSVWDETIVLPGSEIGELAVFARRRGDMWMLAIMNGEIEKSVRVPLSFLGRGKYESMLVRDQKEDAAAVTIEKGSMRRMDQLDIELRAGGGFIARFSKATGV